MITHLPIRNIGGWKGNSLPGRFRSAIKAQHDAISQTGSYRPKCNNCHVRFMCGESTGCVLHVYDRRIFPTGNIVNSNINALLDKGSQIIVSADRAPNKLMRIQERIKSRFSGGLVVDIQKPDLELRKKIVQKKTEELNNLYSDQLQVSKDIQDFISNEISGSIRELVGAVNRIVSFSRIYNKVPNLPETKVVLKDLLNISENKVTIDLIQTIVCKFFKISKNEMLSSRRSRYLVRPRQTAIYLTKILTSKSLPEIGREFSNRDHTTIIHSVKTIEKIKEKDPEMVDNINKLKNQILYNNKENEI